MSRVNRGKEVYFFARICYNRINKSTRPRKRKEEPPEMPKKANQKRRILEVLRFLSRESDEEHPVTVDRIRAHLESAGFPATERP